MKNKLLKYSILGLLCGAFAYLIFSLLVSLRMNTGDFYLVLPALANDYKTELNAAIVQIAIFCWLGIWCGIAYFFTQNVEWSLWKQISGYLLCLTVGQIPLAFAGHWFEHVFMGLISYIFIILCVSFVLFIIGWFQLKNDVNKIKNAIGVQKGEANMKEKILLSSKQIIIWLCVNYGIFILGFFTLGFFEEQNIIIVNFTLDALIIIVSFVLNVILFHPRYKTSFLGKLCLLLITICFAAFTYFAFLMPENGLPPALFAIILPY